METCGLAGRGAFQSIDQAWLRGPCWPWRGGEQWRGTPLVQCDQETDLRRSPPVSRTGGSRQSQDLALSLILFARSQPPALLLSGGLPTLVSPIPQTTVAKPSGGCGVAGGQRPCPREKHS